MAVLSLPARHSVQVPGQNDAIAVFTRWLDTFGCLYWITRDLLSEAEPPVAVAAHPSWSYGEPSIARAPADGRNRPE
ncbi:hypothetical protein [Nonomuraea insulae]|uniref:Uncharacterized protein n=1 Tax=Nonomuraea insulae TaxID=1616787 RepID=A0ABW1DA71_9ACTN